MFVVLINVLKKVFSFNAHYFYGYDREYNQCHQKEERKKWRNSWQHEDVGYSQYLVK